MFEITEKVIVKTAFDEGEACFFESETSTFIGDGVLVANSTDSYGELCQVQLQFSEGLKVVNVAQTTLTCEEICTPDANLNIDEAQKVIQ